MTESEARDALACFYGVRLPDEVARLAAWLSNGPGRIAQFYERFHWEPLIEGPTSGSNERPFNNLPTYPTDPPELIGILGCYTRFGYLCLAPELDIAAPFVCSEPTCYDTPVYEYAADLADALAQLASYGTSSEPRLDEVFGHALEPRSPRTGRPRDLRTTMHIPNGYRYERNVDITGVLAPASAFRPELRSINEMDDFEEHLRYAETCIRDGQPASAILVLRDMRTVWLLTESDFGAKSPLGDFYERLLRMWKAAAIELGREAHASALGRMISQLHAVRQAS